MMTADVSVTPFDRLLPRGAASVYVTVNDGRPPVLTVQRLGVGFVTSSAAPSGAVAVNALTRSRVVLQAVEARRPDRHHQVDRLALLRRHDDFHGERLRSAPGSESCTPAARASAPACAGTGPTSQATASSDIVSTATRRFDVSGLPAES